MQKINSILSKFKIKPNPQFGQNFLISTKAHQLISKAVEAAEGDTVTEIGSGTGELTQHLLQLGANVNAIEADTQFEPLYKHIQQSNPNFEFEFLDAMHLKRVSSKVVGNLPYKMALPILFQLIECGFDIGAFTLQDTMATKLAALPGKPKYGAMSVKFQRLARVQIVGEINRSSFYPQPQVDSTIVKIEPYPSPLFKANTAELTNLLDFFFIRRAKIVEDIVNDALTLVKLHIGAHIVLGPIDHLAYKTPVELHITDYALIYDHFNTLGIVLPNRDSIKQDAPPKKKKRITFNKIKTRTSHGVRQGKFNAKFAAFNKKRRK